jgi:hypothetical protein
MVADVAVDFVRFLGESGRGTRYYLVPALFAMFDDVRLSVLSVRGDARGMAGAADLDGLLNNMTMFSHSGAGGRGTGALVPDGVTSVALTPEGGDEVVQAVRNNFWITTHSVEPLTRLRVVWREEDGSAVGTFPRGYGGE